ncbi:MAG: tetratricopeptide repeat protein [Chloroflexi bacterium]|nr:tetratricopeptide repeat protein [Chloroflexota bacterium]
MSKHTRTHKHLPHVASHAEKEFVSPDAAVERGWDSFNAGRFSDAIKLWERAARHNPAVVSALAETYFRRALAPTTPPEQQLLDLQRATALVPNDARYYYHLGLTHHRRGDLGTALTAYEIAAAANPPPRGLAFTFALAKLESDSHADVSAISGLSELEREIIDLLARFLRGDTTRPPRAVASWVKSLLAKFSGVDASLALWRGVGYLLANDDATAQNALSAANRLTPHGEALKHYYLGTLAARRGDWSAAMISWRQAQARGLATPWLRENLAAVHLPNAIAAAQSENWQAAIEHARTALQANADSADAASIAVIALDRLAHAAVSAGQWAQAAAHWNEGSQVARGAEARTIWHNLAIASEMSEQWAQAATAWRELLRFKPRGKKKDAFTDSHWSWIRKRATQDLQKAGRLGEAIALIKQKIKSTPNDLTTRMELVDALIANQQDTAARNELQRILHIDAHHREARLKLAEWHAARQEWFAAETEMRLLLEQDPTDENARKQIAILMAERGRSLHADGRVAAGRDVIEQAIKYAPHNADLYIDLGRADLDLRQFDLARQDFELAYQHGAKQIHTHEQIAQCWAIAQNLDEVKKAIARAERENEPNPLFYVHVGLACLDTGAALSSPYTLPTAANQTWEKLGIELVERGAARNPNDVELIRHIVMDFAEAHSRFGLPYAERLTQLTATDPMAWLILATMQTLTQDLDKAKANFKQAARFAHQQGNHEIEQMAEQMRRELSNPLLSMALKMGFPLGDLFSGMDEADEFADEDADADLFSLPRRRKRR